MVLVDKGLGCNHANVMISLMQPEALLSGSCCHSNAQFTSCNHNEAHVTVYLVAIATNMATKQKGADWLQHSPDRGFTS